MSAAYAQCGHAARLALAREGGHLTSCKAQERARLSSDHWEASPAPSTWRGLSLALPPSRAPHSGLCSDAFEVLILAQDRVTSSRTTLSEAEGKPVPWSQCHVLSPRGAVSDARAVGM